MSVPTYVPPTVLDQPNPDAAAQVLKEMHTLFGPIEYSLQAFIVNNNDDLLQDISAYLVKNADDAISWDGQANIHTSVQFTISSTLDLDFGKTSIRLWQLIRSVAFNEVHGYPLDSWQRFTLGIFIVTSPGYDDLDAGQNRVITGYDRNYLLQNGLDKSCSFPEGSSYYTAVQHMFLAAGLITATLGEVVSYPTEWHLKNLPTAMSYPMGGGMTQLDVINDLLAASGSLPIYVRPIGRWQVTLVTDPVTQPLRWRWAAGDTPSGAADLENKVVRRHQSRYEGDVYNVTNRWIFIQDGLIGFEPIEGSGLYTVNNLTVPPSDQHTVRRVIRAVQTLQASGQADLKTQGDKIVRDILSKSEKIELSTVPWPAARHLDVFQISHPNLPGTDSRRVQAQTWRLPLWGQPMDWSTYAVARL